MLQYLTLVYDLLSSLAVEVSGSKIHNDIDKKHEINCIIEPLCEIIRALRLRSPIECSLQRKLNAIIKRKNNDHDVPLLAHGMILFDDALRQQFLVLQLIRVILLINDLAPRQRILQAHVLFSLWRFFLTIGVLGVLLRKHRSSRSLLRLPYLRALVTRWRNVRP